VPIFSIPIEKMAEFYSRINEKKKENYKWFLLNMFQVNFSEQPL